MSDLISRQAAIDDIREYMIEPSHCCDESEIKGYNDGLDVAISALATLPSAQPKIIRCKDCSMCEMVEYYGGGEKRVCRLFDHSMMSDDFCSYGERKGGNE